MLRLTKKMEGSLFLLVSLSVSLTLAMKTIYKVDMVDVDENKTITEDLLVDDIHEAPKTGRSSILGANYQWKSPIPYVLDNGLDLNAKGVILRAFDQFRVKSCIDFKPRDKEEFYLSFQKLNGCWSFVGQVIANGQNISIGQNCDGIAAVEHVILHALGFHHEELRYDRDDYVKIDFDNVIADQEIYFTKVPKDLSSTHDVPYDYLSVMHSGKDSFSNGKGSTIITKDPKFQDVIGQRVEMSPRDAEELNLLYKCNSTAAFLFYCDFCNGIMCQMHQMSSCAKGGNEWEVVTQVYSGPSSDHTTLPTGNRDHGQEVGYFIHASTASGEKGDSAWLETQRMSTKRECKVQCLQFYYFNSGNELDKLNIWIREFQHEQDTRGTLRLMGQITGKPTYNWQIHHVSLNATKTFQVVFQVWKGPGNSTGGFSIDDINLSETECPHVTLQIDDFENLLSTSPFGTPLYSPRQYSKQGYAYRIAAVLHKRFVGMYVELLSGDYDYRLEWPCLQKQMTFQLLDQTSSMQKQMSKQRSFVSHKDHTFSNNNSWWDNPRKTGFPVYFENLELVYGGILVGYPYFASLEEMQTSEFLKGGSAIFMSSFEDLTPLVTGNSLPCLQEIRVDITDNSKYWDEDQCFFTGIPGTSAGLAASLTLTLLLGVISMWA